MKTLIYFILCAWIAQAGAQVRIPNSVHRATELETLTAEALADNKALIFIMVNPASTANHVNDAFQLYVRRFRTYGPVILIPQGTVLNNLPAGVDEGFGKLSGGYPRVVAIDPEDGSLIEAVPYLPIRDRDQALRGHRRIISAYLRQKAQERRRRPAVPPPQVLEGMAPPPGQVPQPGQAPQPGQVPQPGQAPQTGAVPQPGEPPHVPPQAEPHGSQPPETDDANPHGH